jgi:hypothetical protein
MLILTGCILAFVHPDYETLTLGIITLGLTGKWAQKITEKKPIQL